MIPLDEKGEVIGGTYKTWLSPWLSDINGNTKEKE
jgi:hypothetical protein